jgi:hypothetical protein|nr:MAG TPA: abortive infection protein [Caudoviricetes sp.]
MSIFGDEFFEEKELMNILIIGNGFDLNHDLPTKYWDFLNFCKYFLVNNGKEEYIDNKNVFNMLNYSVQEYIKKNVYANSNFRNKNIDELKEIINENIWIQYFISNEECNNKGWIDFENEICEMVKALDYLMKYLNHRNKSSGKIPIDDREMFDKAYNFLDTIRTKNINGLKEKFEDPYDFRDDVARKIIVTLNNDLNNLIRCLEIYLEECVEKIDIKFVSPDIASITKIDKILSFNYTSTFQRAYSFVNYEIDYIHGKLDISKDISQNNMVLGIDEYLDEDEKNTDLDFIQFKKYFQRIYKKTGCNYKRWIEEMKEYSSYCNNIYIFGHSLDITDGDILKELILMNNTTTTIFYLNNDVYAQQIANMVKIIGQDELINRVHGSNPSIIFKQQEPRIKNIKCMK